MSGVDSKPSSLASHLDHLITDKNRGPWLRSMSVPLIQDFDPLNHEIETVALRSGLRIHPDNAEMGVSHFASAIFPAIRNHARTYNGKHASIVVSANNGSLPSKAEFSLSRALNTDLGQLESCVHAGMIKAGAPAARITLYSIRLGQGSYAMVTVYGDRTPQDWNAFRNLREEIKERFGAHIHLAHDAEQKLNGVRSDRSLISASDLQAQCDYYMATQRYAVLPKHLRNVVEDWRHKNFISIDHGKTKRPEDLVHVGFKSDGAISLRMALPIAGGALNYYMPFDDSYSIGIQALIGKSGEVLRCRVIPVIAHNSSPLDVHSVNQVLNNEQVSADSKNYERVINIRDNDRIFTQLRTLHLLATRLLSRQIDAGAPVTLELPKNDRENLVQADNIVHALQSFAQNVLAQWLLQSPSGASVVLLKPQFRKARLKVASSPEDCLPEDVCRFKLIRSIVGVVNNLQVFKTFMEDRPLPLSFLEEFVEHMNNRSKTRQLPAGYEMFIKEELRNARAILKEPLRVKPFWLSSFVEP